MNNYYFIILSIVFILYIIHNIRRNDFTIKESFFWTIGCFVMMILSIFPKSIDFLAKKIGVSYPPSLLFVICIIYLLYICFKCSKRIAINEEKIVALTQEVAILKEQANEKEKRK